MYFYCFVYKIATFFSNELNTIDLFFYEYNLFSFFNEVKIYQIFLKKNEISFDKFLTNILFVNKTLELKRSCQLFNFYHDIRILKIETNLKKSDKMNLVYYRFNRFEKNYLFKYIFLYCKFFSIQYLNFITIKAKKIIKYNTKILLKKINSCEIIYIFFKLIKKKINSFIKLHITKVYCGEYKKIKQMLFSNAIFVL